jgi:hypothetical protein
MFNGRPRVARFLGARAIRRIAIISTSFIFLIVAASPRQPINAAPTPQTEPARTRPSQSPQSQTKGGEHERHQADEKRERQAVITGPSLRLEDLERMALQNNPTVAQAEAAIRAAEGRRVQAGLMPNPIIGYAGEELSPRAFGQKSEHYIFAEQEIPLGGKLKKSRGHLRPGEGAGPGGRRRAETAHPECGADALLRGPRRAATRRSARRTRQIGE